MEIFSTSQKQQLQAKLQELTQSNVKLEGRTINFGQGQTFTLPNTSANKEISSRKTTSR